MSPTRPADPFERSLSTSLKGMFNKTEPEIYRRILDTKVFDKEPKTLTDESHKRKFNENRRRIFRHWPRDPKGKILECCPEGKSAPTSSPLWGATLHDIYWVNRFPECETLISASSGSRLAAWAKEVGELTFAEEEIYWAEHYEADPAVRHASDIGDIVECRELMIMLRACGTSFRENDWHDDKPGEDALAEEMNNGDEQMNVDELKDYTAGVENEALDMKGEESSEEKASNAYVPPKPFDYAKYPMPWPLTPFSANSPKLESPIPYHLLPEKLIVHDPFGVLHASQKSGSDYGLDSDSDDTDWKNDPDWVNSTYTYSLRLTDSMKRTIAQKRKNINDAAAYADPLVLLTLWPSQIEGPVRPAVEVTVPPPPSPPICTPEAHLFISPAESIGQGNHSLVYRAEWDLPKTVFFEPTICETCVRNAALDIIRKRDGKLKEGDSDASADDPDPSSMGRFVEHTNDIPALWLDLVEEVSEFRKEGSTIPPHRTGELRPSETVTYLKYEGPKTTVHVDSVSWYTVGIDPEPCNHRVSAAGPLPGPAPPSAQVSVVAKISIPGDSHLAKEAVNYQRFGPHMSEHWTGYTCVHPMAYPTPVGAIVPNFYGYYVKAVKEKDEIVDPDACGWLRPEKREKYFSPIMLLEDCGTPLDVSTLSLDDRRECSALLLRFHHLGWFQGSFYPRNILMQRGDHAEFPLMRSHRDKRFRLIDFGRAESCEGKTEEGWRRWDDQRFDEKNTIWTVMSLPGPM